MQLQVLRSYGSRVVEAVMENSADFGLTQLPVEEKRLQVVNIHRDEIRPDRARRTIRWPTGRRSLPQDVTDYFLVLPKYGKTRTRLNEWLEPVEEDMRISMELDSTEMMKHFVIAGLGISFVAASNCREEIAAGKLKAIPLAPEPMMRRLGLIYRKDKALSKAALGFIQIVLENCGGRGEAARKRSPKPRGWSRDDVPPLPQDDRGVQTRSARTAGRPITKASRHVPDIHCADLRRRHGAGLPFRG